jgi:hypothetical protein
MESERGVEQGEADQHHPGAVLLQRVQAAQTGDQQHDLHRIGVLAHERAPAGLPGHLGERVRAELGQPLGGLRGGEPALDVDAL